MIERLSFREGLLPGLGAGKGGEGRFRARALVGGLLSFAAHGGALAALALSAPQLSGAPRAPEFGASPDVQVDLVAEPGGDGAPARVPAEPAGTPPAEAEPSALPLQASATPAPAAETPTDETAAAETSEAALPIPDDPYGAEPESPASDRQAAGPISAGGGSAPGPGGGAGKPGGREGGAGAGQGAGSGAGAGAAAVVLPFGPGMTRPRLLSGRAPVYTPEARAARVEGTLVVRCVITEQGKVRRCRALKPLPHMVEAVVAALESRRYVPVTFQGRPVAVDYVFNVELVLP